MSSNLMQISFGDDSVPMPLEEVAFDYRLLSEDTREFVMQKTDETQILLKRTTEKIIEIGKNLIEVKDRLPHGMFGIWLKSEFSMTQQTAGNFMRVANKFDGKLKTVFNLPTTALYLLASPDTPQEAIDETLQRADSGEKITKALVQQIIDAQETIKEAQEAEAQARAKMQVQQQLLLKTEEEISVLRQEMADLVKPEVQIHEVEKIVEVLPPEKAEEIAKKTDQLEQLQRQLEQVTDERDNEKARAETFAEKFREDLSQKKIDEQDERIRQRWRSLTSEFHITMMGIFSQWPTTLDTQSFEPDDWARLSQIAGLARRFYMECDNLSNLPKNMVVDVE